LDCAIREFEEETSYKAADLNFGQPPYRSFTEDFIGTNGVRYVHIYYIAEIDASLPIPEMTRHQLGEIQNVGWFNEEEITSVLRPYDDAKKEVIRRAFQYRLQEGFYSTSPSTDTKEETFLNA
jgi:8-oxo-dGTP pyrophosphatase MutT (NUDIX family)